MASATMENFAGLDVALQPASLSLYATKQALIQGYLATAPNGKIPSARLFFREIAVGVCRDGITATVREGLKLLVQKTASPALTRRLTKVVGTSAVRKHARYTQAAADSAALHFPLLHAALDTVPVAVFSSLLPQLATLLVEEAIVVVVYLRSHGRERDRTALVLHTKQNVFLCFASVALGGVCAGVGTAISPGRGTNAGLFIGNAIMYLI